MNKSFKVIATYNVEHKETWTVNDVADKDEAIFAVDSGKSRYYTNRTLTKEEDNIEDRVPTYVATEIKKE